MKAIPFEVYMRTSIRRHQRIISNTAAMDLKLASVWRTNQDLLPLADRLPLTNILPYLHTKRQDELEMLASLMYFNPCSELFKFNYFFKPDGSKKKETPSCIGSTQIPP